MKKIIIIPALIVLSLAAGAGGLTLAIGPTAALGLVGLGSPAEAESADAGTDGEKPDKTGKSDDYAAGDGKEGKDDKKGAKKQAGFPVLPFPELIVNVTDVTATGRQTTRFLKLNMLMVYDDKQEGADRLLSREVYLRDTFQDYLRQLHVSDLRGTRGLAMMKTELLRRARAVGNSDAPAEILISDMVVQ
ncbi:MAG: flagellar motor switch protein M [Rhodobacteraceae bacterium]|nr:flagellar motor switch protein M [Paracoccaceae bacterium]